MPITAAEDHLSSISPVLTTARLILRPLVPEDAAALVAALNDEAVIEWLCQVPFPYTLDDAHDWIIQAGRDRLLDRMLALGVFDRTSGVLLGSVSLTRNSDIEAEIGYWLRQDAWGQGRATEMVQRMVAFGFDDMGLSGQIAALRADNVRSVRVLEKCHFRPVGDRVYIRPPRMGCLSGPHWYLTRPDWAARC